MQVVITSNKECVTAERDLAVNFGTLCVSNVSKVVDPKSFESLEGFLEVVKEIWRKTWTEAYGPEFRAAQRGLFARWQAGQAPLQPSRQLADAADAGHFLYLAGLVDPKTLAAPVCRSITGGET